MTFLCKKYSKLKSSRKLIKEANLEIRDHMFWFNIKNPIAVPLFLFFLFPFESVLPYSPRELSRDLFLKRWFNMMETSGFSTLRELQEICFKELMGKRKMGWGLKADRWRQRTNDIQVMHQFNFFFFILVQLKTYFFFVGEFETFSLDWL